jgi:spermidine synthase
MEYKEWINGKFEETESDYKIAGYNILYKNEKEYLTKGIELLCEKLNPTSVLEFGFGKGWTATKFQNLGVQRHVILEANKEVYQAALEWKAQFDTDIEILNIFSWDFETSEVFDLVYDDREPFTESCDNNHFAQMAKILPIDQWYACNADYWPPEAVETPLSYVYSMNFEIDGIGYRQSLTKGFYGVWQQ